MDKDPLYYYYVTFSNDDRLYYLSQKTSFSKVRQCLLEFVAKTDFEERPEIKNYLINYFEPKENGLTPSQIVKKAQTKNFKSLYEFFTGENDSLTKDSGLSLARELINYDMTVRDEVEGLKVVGAKGDKDFKGLLRALESSYLSDSRFTSIQINGDIDNRIGGLPMESYYVHTSYLKEYETVNRDSLIQLEKEQSRVKVNPVRVANYSQGYITETAISSDRALIIGNPGVGKSTFARWMCHRVAATSRLDSIPLVYVQLRDLDFDEPDFLENYTKAEYRFDVKGESWERYEDLKWVLDGFDELDGANKAKLLQKVKRNRYVILSRPYGLINQSIDFSVAIQIDGFDDMGIQRYINNILPDESAAGELSRVLKENRVLSNYASTPLMLSYIALVFISSDKGKEKLLSISSIYELQEQVYNWMLSYHLMKGKGRADVSKESKKVQEFAYNMLVGQKYSYIGNLDDIRFNMAHLLSEIGVGSLVFLPGSFKWKFTFITVTFQEFLASKYLVDRIKTPEPMVYLITHNFFWNTCLMLTGALSSKMHSSEEKRGVLEETLAFLKDFYSKHNHPYYGYSYYMVLAECSKELINQRLDSDRSGELIEFYKVSHLDSFWEKTILESIRHIVHKLSWNKKGEFIGIVLEHLTGVTEKTSKNAPEIGFYYYLIDLLEIIIRYDEPKVTETLVATLGHLGSNIKDWGNRSAELEEELAKQEKQGAFNWETEEQYNDAFDNENWGKMVRSMLFGVLEQSSVDSLLKNKAVIERICGGENPDVLALKKVIHKIRDKEDLDLLKIAQRSLIQGIQELGVGITHAVFNELFSDSLYFFERIYCFLKHHDDDNIGREALSEIEGLLFPFVDSILKATDVEHKSLYSFEYLLDLLILCLCSLNTMESLERAFLLSRNFNHSIKERIPSKEYRQIAKKALDKAMESRSDADFEFVWYIFTHKHNRTDLPLEFRDVLLGILLDSIPGKEGKDLGFAERVQYLNTIYTANHDRKYLIDRILEKNPGLFQEDGRLLELFDGFVFYEEKYWALAARYFKNRDNLMEALDFLNNEDLFMFKSNTGKLVKIYVDILSHVPIEVLRNNAGDFLVVTSNVLMVLKSCSEKIREPVIKKLRPLLDDREVQKYCTYELTDLSRVKHIHAFILYYNFSNHQRDFLKGIDFHSMMKNEPMAISSTIDTLIEFSMNGNHYGIEINEIEPYKDVLGERLYNKLMETIKQRLLEKVAFNRDQLEMVLG